MKYTELGSTGEKIPVVGLGLGKGKGEEAKTAAYGDSDERLIRLGIDLGMTLIDVASDYGSGRAEEVLGRALVGVREKVFIATKFPPGKSSCADVVRSAEESLARLKTDRIDLFQTHWPHPKVPFEETLGAMEKLVRSGKVRHIGLSNCSVDEAKKALSVLMKSPVESIQHEYNLFDRTAESEIMPFCAAQGLTFIGYSPLAHRKAHHAAELLSKTEEIAGRYSLSSTQLVLSWLTRIERTMVVVQTSDEQHLLENARIGDIAVSAKDLDLISSLFESRVQKISASLMRVKSDNTHKVYTTEQDARENRFELSPSPVELAEQVKAGDNLKPIKIRIDPHEKGSRHYEVVEGKLRYWAWVIAFGDDARIPSLGPEQEKSAP